MGPDLTKATYQSRSRKTSQWVRNACHLLVGNSAASILGFATLAVTARALQPHEFGILVLVQTYVMVVDQLVNFQSWRAVIKFGADSLHGKRYNDFRQLVKFGTCIDTATAIVATALALAGSVVAASFLKWDADILQMAQVYSVVILFNVAGTPTGVLRLFDRFDWLSAQKVIGESFRLVGAVVALTTGAGLWGFVLVWMCTTILGYVLLLTMGWTELRRHGYGDFLQARLSGIAEKHPGLWGFVWTTNLTAGIRLASRELDVLVVGGVLGSASAGLYKVAKQIASVLARLSDPFYQAIYPELAKLWASQRQQDFVRLAVRSGLFAGGIALLCWVGFIALGEPLLTFAFSEEFAAAYRVTIPYMLATVIAVAGFPLQPVMLSMGRPHLSFWVHVGSTAVYYPILLWCLHKFGLMGAGMAYVGCYLLFTAAMVGLEYIMLRRYSGGTSILVRA